MRKPFSGLLVVGLAVALAACGSDSADKTTGVDANKGATIGIAMPTKTSDRWLADGKNMVEQFTAMGYKVNLQYANDEVKTQVGQVKTMIEQGDKLLVIAAVDGSSMTEVLTTAAAKNVPVIAYDRLLTKTKDVGYQATFDNDQVGVMQGQVIVDGLRLNKGAKGPFNIELFAGSGTDVNAKSFYVGAMRVLKPYIDSGVLVVRSGETKFETITTLNYSGDLAAKRLKKLMSAHYKTATLDALLSPYDGMTVSMIKVLKAGGYGTAKKPLPYSSGQDAELGSVKSIVSNEQTGTIYKDTRELAKVAVQQGNALLTGAKPLINDTTSFNNGVKFVPTYLLYPVAVNKSNYQTLLVDSGYYSTSELKG